MSSCDIPPLFPRGPGPLVTVMVPSRKRPEALYEMIRSAHDLAANPRSVEFVVKVDDDDPAALAAAVAAGEDIVSVVKIANTPRGRGFLDVHHWVNNMCGLAEGDWVTLLNDDALIVTERWDEILLNFKGFGEWPGFPDVCLLLFREEEQLRSFAFPALRRRTFEILGHFSRTQLCDHWIFWLMFFLKAAVPIPIHVKHDRVRFEGDEARWGTKGITEQLWWATRSPEAMREVLHDAQRLQRHIEAGCESRAWVKEPVAGKWNWWRQAKGFSEGAMYVFPEGNTAIRYDREQIDGRPRSTVYEVGKVGGEWSVL